MPLTPQKVPAEDIIRQTRLVVDANADLLLVDGVATGEGFTLEASGGESISVDLTETFLTRAEAQQLASVGIASEDQSGRLKISTETQARQGTDDTTAMTPYKVALAFLARNLPFFNFDDATPGKQVVVDSVDPDTGSVTLKLVDAISAKLREVLRNGNIGEDSIILKDTLTGFVNFFLQRGPIKVFKGFTVLNPDGTTVGSFGFGNDDSYQVALKQGALLVIEQGLAQILTDLKVSDWLTAKQAAVTVAPLVTDAEYKLVTHYDSAHGWVIERQLNTNSTGSGKTYDLTTPILYRDATVGINESATGNNWQIMVRENIGPGQWKERIISQQQLGQYALVGMSADDLRNKLAGASEVAGDSRKPVGFYCRPMPTPAQTTQAYNVNASMFGVPQSHNLQTTGANIMGILLNSSGQFEQNVTLTYPDSGHFLLTPVSADMTDWTGKLRLDKTVTT